MPASTGSGGIVREIPSELLRLRALAADSYSMRDDKWRPDPVIVAELVKAEIAFTNCS